MFLAAFFVLSALTFCQCQKTRSASSLANYNLTHNQGYPTTARSPASWKQHEETKNTDEYSPYPSASPEVDSVAQLSELLDTDVYNCSVLHSASFQHHVRCDLEVQCHGGEDEADCPYTTPACGTGYVDMGTKCYKLYRLSESVNWNTADDLCRLLGMTLVNPRTPSELKELKAVLRLKSSLRRIFLGLHAPKKIPGLTYRDVWQWADETMAFYAAFHVQEMNTFSQNSRPMCSEFVLETGTVESTNCEKNKNSTFNLCEKKKLSSSSAQFRTLAQADRNFTTTKGRVEMIECPNGHVVKDFLSCDPLSNCGVHSYQMSCQTSQAGVVPLFACHNNIQTVPYTLVCDHRHDCSDGSDETLCVSDPCSGRMCKNGQCVADYKWCDGFRQDCVDGSDEREQCLPLVIPSHDVAPPALVVVNVEGVGFPTPLTFKLISLTDDETCPSSHFWCADGFCIPAYLRCNGVKDCTGHEDEADCDWYTCPGFYRCRDSAVCVHPDNVCDGIFQCPQQDDELLCDLTCPEGCRCQGLAFVCAKSFPFHAFPSLRYLDMRCGSGVTPTALKDSVYLVGLKLWGCGVHDLPTVNLPNLRTLDLSDSHLTSVDNGFFLNIPYLSVLRLSYNNITHWGSRGKGELQYLRTLDLSHTHVDSYDTILNAHYPQLRTLNLSFTALHSVTNESFVSMRGLTVLDLRGCPLDVLRRDTLKHHSLLKTIYATSYKLCCPATLPANVNNCESPQDVISSCEDLLRSDVYRVCLWLMSLFAVVGNGSSLFTRFYLHKESAKSSFNMFVTHLNVADFLMGVYLAILGAADQVYRGGYLWHDTAWKHSVACRTAGFLSLLSSEMSTFLICLITLDRFVALRFVFSRVRFSPRSAAASCAVLWAVALILAAVPLLPVTSHWQLYSQTGICIPLSIAKSDSDMLPYSFGVMVVLNMSMFVLIAVGQIFIYRSVQQNSFVSDQRTAKDVTIARRLTSIVLSDFLCWFPVGVLGVLAANGTGIPGEIGVFVAIFVLPVNSALNPFLYTLNLLLQRRRKAAEARLTQHLLKQLASTRSVKSVGVMVSLTEASCLERFLH